MKLSTKVSRNVRPNAINIASRTLHLNTRNVYDISYGTPGRHANSGITSTVFGAYGFLGRYFMNELGQIGSRAYAPFRGCESEPRVLKPMFDLGQLGLLPFHPRDEASIHESLKASNVVVNMIGKHYETKHIVPHRMIDGKASRVNFTMDEVHNEIPGRIARIAKEAGVETFIHVSSSMASLDSASEWARSKARGEIAVREAFPEAIIVRPNTVFGAEDRFLNWIAETIEKFPFMPILEDGKYMVQPVHCVDVAKGIMEIVQYHEDYAGETFEFHGPAEYTMREVVEFVQDITTLDTPVVTIPNALATGIGRVLEETITPRLTSDSVKLMLEDNIASPSSEHKGLKDLGIEPRSMDKVAFDYLHRFRPGGHFTMTQGYH